MERETTVFLDESGHSGDLVSSGESYDFMGQPYFVLAGVGLESGHDWDGRLQELRQRHRIPEGELKSKSLTAKPAFSAEIIHALIDQRNPLFVELNDKRYFVCASIASFRLLAPCLRYEASPELQFIQNTVADFLYFHAPSTVLDTYVASCLNPEPRTVLASFAVLGELVNSPSTFSGADVQIATGIRKMVEVAKSDYHELASSETEPWSNFLPPPDLNRRLKQVWLLPNLTSFTSIYARVNRYFDRRLSSVRLVHDQQLEIEEILRKGKAAMEALSGAVDLAHIAHSDFQFDETARLDFGQSHRETGLQLADVVAGATMRLFRDLDSGASVAPELREAVMRLVTFSDENTGYGLNQVVPASRVRAAASSQD